MPVTRTWLLAATAAPDGLDRAGAAYALGCAGEAGDGVDRLVTMLDDESPFVREAAALGLGEHGGPRARFALVRALASAGRDERFACITALALGLAAAADGALPATELHHRAANAASTTVREAICAAADLCGSACLHDLAESWLASLSFGAAPGNAVRSAAAGRADSLADLPRAWFPATNEAVRLAALAQLVRGRVTDAAFVHQQLDSASPQRTARAILVVAAWRDFPGLAAAAMTRSPLRVAYGFGLAVHARSNRLLASSQIALAERTDHTAEHRPLWLIALGLARDPAAAARARVVLSDVRCDERLRRAAIDVLAMGAAADLEVVREAMFLDPSMLVRVRAADSCARHGSAADVASLLHAVRATANAEERAALLVSLGRTRVAAAVALLREHAEDRRAPAIVRRGAWLGLAHWLRPGGESALANLPRHGGHTWLSPWLLELVDAVR